MRHTDITNRLAVMVDIEPFEEEGIFTESSLCTLFEIFETSRKTQNKKIIKELESLLSSVLKQEDNMKIRTWESPNGNNYIIVSKNLCLFINVYGINILFDSWLFDEGELEILNFHWIECDNMVVFDVYYIVHDIRQKCICHFANDDFFVYFTNETKFSNIASIDDSSFNEEW